MIYFISDKAFITIHRIIAELVSSSDIGASRNNVYDFFLEIFKVFLCVNSFFSLSYLP